MKGDAVPVRVTCHAGMRGDESPRAFVIGQRRVQVREVLGEWIEQDRSGAGSRRRVFDVLGEDGRPVRLIHHLGQDAWSAVTDPGLGKIF